jgi:hypothetical protein
MNADFFVQLACQSLLRGFSGLNLSAGKLPLQRHRLIWTALADQDLAATHNQRSHNEAERWTSGPSVWI